MEKLNNRLKYLRKEVLKLSMKTFSDKINVSQSAISTYEIGSSLPGTEFIVNVCLAYNVSANWLLLNTGPIFISDLNVEFTDTAQLKIEKDKRFKKELSELYSKLEKLQQDYLNQS